jgi:hypothetical protein
MPNDAILGAATARPKEERARAKEGDRTTAHIHLPIDIHEIPPGERRGTEVHVPTAAKITAAKARTARTPEEATPMAEAYALRGGTEVYVRTAAKARTPRASEEDTSMA